MSTSTESLRRQRAHFYSSLSFLRGHEATLASSTLEGLEQARSLGNLRCTGGSARAWVRHLEWDSRYFGIPTYRLDFADWDASVADPAAALAATLSALKEEMTAGGQGYYFFADVPTEDIVVLQALGLAGLRLIETRLTYFHDRLDEVDVSRLRPTRMAGISDIPGLRSAAGNARNPYDRFHADPFFSARTADEFVAEYVEQSVRGLADVVLVPAEGASADGFVCGKLAEPAPFGIKAGRLTLAAVDAPRRGWYRDLNAALLCWMRDQGMAYCLNTTQSTNRSVIHVCEQLGYRCGRISHVLAGYCRPVSAHTVS